MISKTIADVTVLVNLITNAVKFTSRKKGDRKIIVSMGASTERPTSYPPNVIYFGQDKETFHVDSTRSSEWGNGDTLYLMVAVKDSGIGISKDDQAKLFERFRQATPKTQEKYGGSGLGLFISRKLCQLHGGDIGVSSKEGDGSTFGFFFKVRRSDGSSEDGRPPFSSRSNSENPSTPKAHGQTQRPGYSRANSNLNDIKERTNEQGRKEFKVEAKESDQESRAKKNDTDDGEYRPGPETLAGHSGIDPDDVDPSLKDPPTGYFPEAHPESAEDHRYRETESIAHGVSPPVEGHDDERVPYAESGESARQEVAAEKAHKAQKTRRSEDKRTLLLVEDNLINQKVLRRQLQSRGFEVFVANNGQEAVDAVFERGKTASEDEHNRDYFDCILMDQEMPIKDGNAATSEIRQLQNEGKAGYSKILGVSANVREAQRNSMREAGMDDLISKPFKVEDLVKKIDGLTIDGGEGKLREEARKGIKGTQMTEEEKVQDKKEKDKKQLPDGAGKEEEKPGGKQEEKREAKQNKTREKDKARKKPDRDHNVEVDGEQGSEKKSGKKG
jgi:CheY-like chemotaxis protein